MQNSYNLKHEDPLLVQASKGLAVNAVIDLFSDALRTLFKRASRSLNKNTLETIIEKVVCKSSKKYPILSKLKIKNAAVVLDKDFSKMEQSDVEELRKSFYSLYLELSNVLGNLTGDVVSDSKYHLNYDKDTMESKKLECLYEVSKSLVTFESMEKNFTEILMAIESIVSLKTVLLVEKKDNGHELCLWHDGNASNECINQAVEYSRSSCEYFLRPDDDVVIYDFPIEKYSLPVCSLIDNKDCPDIAGRYISLPLALNTNEVFGLLQFECLEMIDEAELSFINTLSNLIAVVLDRYNKEKEEALQRQAKLSEKVIELDEIHKYVSSLEEERGLREQFVATLTHDLRTPLTSVKMAAQLILRRSDDAEKNKQLAVQVIRGIDRLDQMIQDLLDVNRIRAGEGLSLTMNYCNLKEIALVSIRDLATLYGDRFVLKVNQPDIFGFWNEDGLRRVIENLAANAAKYGASDKTISIILKQADDFVQISVHNFGNPISIEEQLELFKPFHRTTTAKNGNKKGWGLGLTLVRGVVDAHGGKISINSRESEGTEFTATIPKDARSFQVLN